MKTPIVFYEALEGEDIAVVIKKMLSLAKRKKQGIVTIFNNVAFAVNPNSQYEDIYSFWEQEVNRNTGKIKEPLSQSSAKYQERRYRGC